MINEDGVEIEHGMVVYEPWKGGYYLKSEADKVIADLEESHKMEVEQLLMEIVELNEGAQNLILDNYLKDKEARHSNYKRCLAMANMCREAVCFWDNVKYTYFKGEAYCFRKLKHYGKWGQIWLSIAYKFKEARNV